jgi:hypothetical protein
MLSCPGHVPVSAAEPPIGDVFASFTGHIRQQIQSDKQRFVEADVCTQWFYQQHRKKTPATPPAQGVAYRRAASGRPALDAAQCPTRYPGGLEAARLDFSRTQSSLALSLTFYEFALVGDANDDGRYSPAELKDIMGSFGLASDGLPGSAARLTATFDALHEAGGMDSLMTSMGILYDKGYRFTASDRDELTRIAG